MESAPKWPHLSAQLADELASHKELRCRVVGIAGAQGSGKTSLARELVAAIQARGKRAALISLDDYYLSRAERAELAKTVHPLLATRGVPGTHHVRKLCQDIQKAIQNSGTLHVPIFDKQADDVCGETRAIVLPLDVLIVEGWCLGAQQQSPASLAMPVNELERRQDPDMIWRRFVNDALKYDHAKLNEALDALIFLKAPNFEIVAKWRTQAEQEAYAAHGESPPNDLDRQMKEFVAHYERITRHMLAGGVDAKWIIQLTAQREILK